MRETTTKYSHAKERKDTLYRTNGDTDQVMDFPAYFFARG